MHLEKIANNNNNLYHLSYTLNVIHFKRYIGVDIYIYNFWIFLLHFLILYTSVWAQGNKHLPKKGVEFEGHEPAFTQPIAYYM